MPSIMRHWIGLRCGDTGQYQRVTVQCGTDTWSSLHNHIRDVRHAPTGMWGTGFTVQWRHILSAR